MMCSPRELALPNAPQKRGVIELSDDQVVGTPLTQLHTGLDYQRQQRIVECVTLLVKS